MATTAYGSETRFNRTFQEWIPSQYNYRGLKDSYFIDCIQNISYHTKQEGLYSMGMARFWVAVLPIAAGASLLQNGAIAGAHFISSGLGAKDQESLVDETGKKEFSNVSLSKDLWDLAYHVAATVLVCFPFAYFVFLAAPGFLQTKDQEALPQSEQEEELERLTALVKSTDSDREKAARTDTAEREAKRLLEENTRLQRLVDQAPSVRETAVQEAKVETYLSLFPPITPDNVDQLLPKLEDPELQGIQFKRYNGAAYNDYSQGSWSVKRGYFEKGKTHLEQEALKNPELFLIPAGVVELSIDCTSLKDPHLTTFLRKGHHVHRLVLSGVDLDTLADPKWADLLSTVHTLVLRPKGEERTYFSRTLIDLSLRYPKIACFDLTGCTFNSQEELDPLENPRNETARLLVLPNFERPRVSFEPERNNLKGMFQRFNHKVFTIVNDYDHSRPDLFSAHFPIPQDGRLFDPVAPFITKLEFFRGSPIRTGDFVALVPKIPHLFPHLEVLDCEYCRFLESDIFNYLADLKIQYLYFTGCDAIFYRRDRKITKDKDADLTIDRRYYLLNLPSVVSGVTKLFQNGAKLISFRGVAVSHKKWTTVLETFSFSINPTVYKLSQPPYGRMLRVEYDENTTYSGV